MLLFACGRDTSPEIVTGTSEYTVRDASHEISILYPEFSKNAGGQALTDEIRARSISYMEEYLRYRNTAGAFYEYTVDQVNAAYQSSTLVSILQIGSFYTEGASHPEPVVYTFNVNPETAAVFEFGDIVTDFDRIAKLFEDGAFRYLGGASPVFEETADSLNPADLFAGYSSLYGIYPPVFFMQRDDNVYFTLSIELADTLGGHAEFGIPAESVREALSEEIQQILFN